MARIMVHATTPSSVTRDDFKIAVYFHFHCGGLNLAPVTHRNSG